MNTTTTAAAITKKTTISVGVCPSEILFEEDSEEIALLRYIRDAVLSQTTEGRKIIKIYYELSPVVVKMMEENEMFKS